MSIAGIEASRSGGTCACCFSFDLRFVQVPNDGFSHNADEQVRSQVDASLPIAMSCYVAGKT